MFELTVPDLYLQKEMAEEKYLDSQMGKRMTDPMRRINQHGKVEIATETLKILLASKQSYENANLSKALEEQV